MKGVGEMHLLPTSMLWPDAVLAILGSDANQTELIWLGGTLIGAIGLSWVLRRRER
ncbi:LPXTG cell wall anchor domain-containing protein [Levilactobacillus lindianensis]|uniref:LPXTG cell wall anchor domain-containing protein n=1 Tax=Levilactobacillus lindianensis TaxID=2486018 RepID=UPI000F747E61|nr:LPXTG cell wall anchor domain-containing protein [Levilactobacillus lindianensis]